MTFTKYQYKRKTIHEEMIMSAFSKQNKRIHLDSVAAKYTNTIEWR